MIKKLWVKWDGMDVECICDEHHRKCQVYPGGELPCKEYVVKFTEVDRTEKEAEKKIKDAGAALKKFESELRKKTKQLDKLKIT